MTQTNLLDGTHLTLTSGRAVVEASENRRSIVRLEAGTAYLTVPHLPDGNTFTLTTTEGEVRVRGTRFAVAMLREGMKVSVSEGTVEVRPRTTGSKPFLVTKGESRSVVAQPTEADAQGQARAAWALSRQGDRPGALAAYRHALSMLSPEARPLWADNACAQLAVLVERDDPAAAATAWRAYLERFPAGIHSAMARDRLVGLSRGTAR